MEAMLYAYLVVRRLPDVGYDLRLRWRDLLVGMREWAFFAPIAILLGTAIGFIRFRPYLPVLGSAAAAWLITFFFVALPEELFFRGLLQNLLERRFQTSATSKLGALQTPDHPLTRTPARTRALLLASVIFGLSHFNKPLPFNWRYVILATIAGIFYGRAWLDRRRLGCSAITHATVDVVWGLWFHK
jgi:membrane protease YdiL (CAAX protease family)